MVSQELFFALHFVIIIPLVIIVCLAAWDRDHNNNKKNY